MNRAMPWCLAWVLRSPTGERLPRAFSKTAVHRSCEALHLAATKCTPPTLSLMGTRKCFFNKSKQPICRYLEFHHLPSRGQAIASTQVRLHSCCIRSATTKHSRVCTNDRVHSSKFA